MIDRTIPPTAAEIQQIEIQEAKKITLANSAPLYYISSGQLPVIRIEFIFRSGSYYESKNGQSYFAAKMITEGASGYSAKEIAQTFDYYGSYIEISPSMDHVSVVVYTLSKHLEIICSLLTKILEQPKFPEKELLVQKRIKRQAIKINQEKSAVVASQTIRKSIFGAQHPYGRSFEIEDVDAITREDLAIYRSTMLYNDPVVVVSGGVNDCDMKIISQSFAKMSYSRDVAFESITSDLQPNELLIERKDAVQSSVRLGKLAIAKNHSDYIGLVVLNEIFGGYFGSRLMKNIREDKGYTYGIYSSLVNLQKADMMIIGTDVGRASTQATITEIHKEMALLRNEKVGADELTTVKNYMLGSFMSSINSPFSLADKFKSIFFHDLGYEFYQNYIEGVRAVDSEELQRLANIYLQEDSFSRVIVGGY
jgi:predicted Zn-dependent peptidase